MGLENDLLPWINRSKDKLESKMSTRVVVKKKLQPDELSRTLKSLSKAASAYQSTISNESDDDDSEGNDDDDN